LTKEKKVNYGDDITSQLRRARRLKWEKQEEVRQNQEIELLVKKYFLSPNLFIYLICTIYNKLKKINISFNYPISRT